MGLFFSSVFSIMISRWLCFLWFWIPVLAALAPYLRRLRHIISLVLEKAIQKRTFGCIAFLGRGLLRACVLAQIVGSAEVSSGALGEAGTVAEVGTFCSGHYSSRWEILLVGAPWQLVHREAFVEYAKATSPVHGPELHISIGLVQRPQPPLTNLAPERVTGATRTQLIVRSLKIIIMTHVGTVTKFGCLLISHFHLIRELGQQGQFFVAEQLSYFL